MGKTDVGDGLPAFFTKIILSSFPQEVFRNKSPKLFPSTESTPRKTDTKACYRCLSIPQFPLEKAPKQNNSPNCFR